MRNGDGDDMVMDMAQHQQFNMMNIPPPSYSVVIQYPPPSYSEVMVYPVPEPPASKNVLLDLIFILFGLEPPQLTCWSCRNQVRL